MKALFVAGNVPDADLKSDFLVVQTSHLTALAEKADVVLPMAALYERGGTIVHDLRAAEDVYCCSGPRRRGQRRG